MAQERIGNRHWSVNFTDAAIAEAAVEWEPVHADAPTEIELVELRSRVADVVASPLIESMVSLHWLRNEFVRIRKSGVINARMRERELERTQGGGDAATTAQNE